MAFNNDVINARLLLLLHCRCSTRLAEGQLDLGFRAPEDVKAQWAARPPMFGPAPLAKSAAGHRLARRKLAKPRTPAPLGEPLWPFPAQRYDADVVTGLALNYREFAYGRPVVDALKTARYGAT